MGGRKEGEGDKEEGRGTREKGWGKVGGRGGRTLEREEETETVQSREVCRGQE